MNPHSTIALAFLLSISSAVHAETLTVGPHAGCSTLSLEQAIEAAAILDGDEE